MATTAIASTTQYMGSATSFSFTIPLLVEPSHLGIIVITTSGSEGVTGWDVDGWTTRVLNPTGQGTSEFGLFTRLGGMAAGGTVSITTSSSRATAVTAVWFDTDGRDVSIIGAPGTRNSVSGATTTIPSVTTVSNGQDLIVVATERSQNAPTTITGWTPSAPTQASYNEFSQIWSSHYIGSRTGGAKGATGDYVVTYSTSSAAAAGVLLAITPTVVGWIKDPTGTGGKRQIIRRRNPSDNENVDGGVFSQTVWDASYDGGAPATVEFLDLSIDGGGVNG